MDRRNIVCTYGMNERMVLFFCVRLCMTSPISTLLFSSLGLNCCISLQEIEKRNERKDLKFLIINVITLIIIIFSS